MSQTGREWSIGCSPMCVDDTTTSERENGGVRRPGGRHGRTPTQRAHTIAGHGASAPAPTASPPRSWALTVGAGWPLLLVVMTALAPEPADPNAVPTFVDSAVFLAVMVGILGTIVAAVARQPKALAWSTGLGAVWVATTIACPLSGHHDAVGWQWYAELVSSSTLLVLSLIGIRLLRRPQLSEVWARN